MEEMQATNKTVMYKELLHKNLIRIASVVDWVLWKINAKQKLT